MKRRELMLALGAVMTMPHARQNPTPNKGQSGADNHRNGILYLIRWR